MKKNRNMFIAIAATTLSLLAGCEKDKNNPQPGPDEKGTPITITGGVTTRATDAIWHAGDAIGLYTLVSGTTNVFDAQANFKYTNTAGEGATATFEPANAANTAYYPTDDSHVDVIAYYPYAVGAGLVSALPIDVSNQTSLPAIDLMTSELATGYSAGNANVALTFRHRLAKLAMVIKTDETTADIDPATATIVARGIPTQGTYNLLTQAITATANIQDIAIKGRTAIVVPTAAGSGVNFVVTAGGRDFTAPLPQDIDLRAGKVITIIITLHQEEGGGNPVAAIKATITDWEDGPTVETDAIRTVIATNPTTGAPEVPRFYLWKNNDEASAAFYEYTAGEWSATPAFFLIEDVLPGDVFNARFTPDDEDPVTGIKDILEAGPATMSGEGIVDLTFRHINAQLSIRLYAGTGFTDEALLPAAEVTYAGFTYTGADKTFFINPATFAAADVIASVQVGAHTYNARIAEPVSFAAGTRNTLNITLKVEEQGKATAAMNVTAQPWTVIDPIGVDAIRTVNVTSPPDGNTEVSEFTLYKNKGTAGQAAVPYKLVGTAYEAQGGAAPFYIEDIVDTDRFVGEAILSTDALTGIEDIIIAPETAMNAGTGVIDLAFVHVNAKLTVNLVNGTFDGSLDDATYTLLGHTLTGSSNTLYIEGTTPAQQIAAGTFSITTDGKVFTATIAQAIELAGGTHTTLTITLNSETAAGLNVTLAPWGTGEAAATALYIYVPNAGDDDTDGNLTAFDLWMNADYANRLAYQYNAATTLWDITNGKTPFYVENIGSTDRFYARYTPSPASPNEAPDILVVNSAAMAANNQLTLAFAHAMSKLTLVIKPGTGLTQADVDGATLTLALKNFESISPANVLTTSATATSKTIAPGSYVFVPQAHTALPITVTIGTKTYTGAVNINLTAGNESTVTLTINPTGVKANVSVTDWGIGDPMEGHLELD